MLILYLCLFSTAFSTPQHKSTELQKSTDCESKNCYVSSDYECTEACGCDSALVYNKTTGECVLKKIAMIGVIYVYDNSQDPEAHESFLAKNIRQEDVKAFKGVTVAAILFISCATACAIAACLYCCRISYSDEMLASDIKTLGKKLGRYDRLPATRASVKTSNKRVGESCPVVVEDAGVFIA